MGVGGGGCIIVLARVSPLLGSVSTGVRKEHCFRFDCLDVRSLPVLPVRSSLGQQKTRGVVTGKGDSDSRRIEVS